MQSILDDFNPAKHQLDELRQMFQKRNISGINKIPDDESQRNLLCRLVRKDDRLITMSLACQCHKTITFFIKETYNEFKKYIKEDNAGDAHKINVLKSRNDLAIVNMFELMLPETRIDFLASRNLFLRWVPVLPTYANIELVVSEAPKQFLAHYRDSALENKLTEGKPSSFSEKIRRKLAKIKQVAQQKITYMLNQEKRRNLLKVLISLPGNQMLLNTFGSQKPTDITFILTDTPAKFKKFIQEDNAGDDHKIAVLTSRHLDAIDAMLNSLPSQEVRDFFACPNTFSHFVINILSDDVQLIELIVSTAPEAFLAHCRDPALENELTEGKSSSFSEKIMRTLAQIEQVAMEQLAKASTQRPEYSDPTLLQQSTSPTTPTHSLLSLGKRKGLTQPNSVPTKQPRGLPPASTVPTSFPNFSSDVSEQLSNQKFDNSFCNFCAAYNSRKTSSHLPAQNNEPPNLIKQGIFNQQHTQTAAPLSTPPKCEAST